jgi:hypothetical protein
MSFGNISNNQIPNYQGISSIQGPNSAGLGSSVNIPTLLPPGASGRDPREYGINFARRSMQNPKTHEGVFHKLTDYFKHLGKALIGKNDEMESKPSKAHKLFGYKKENDPDFIEASKGYDPVVGQWPASFNSAKANSISPNNKANMASSDGYSQSETTEEEIDLLGEKDGSRKGSSQNASNSNETDKLDQQGQIQKLLAGMNSSKMQNQLLALQGDPEDDSSNLRNPFENIMQELQQSTQDNEKLFNTIQSQQIPQL